MVDRRDGWLIEPRLVVPDQVVDDVMADVSRVVREHGGLVAGVGYGRSEMPPEVWAAVPEPPPVGFSDFTLGEVQLLALGLWVIGDLGMVDHELHDYFDGLKARLRVAAQRKVAEVRRG